MRTTSGIPRRKRSTLAVRSWFVLAAAVLLAGCEDDSAATAVKDAASGTDAVAGTDAAAGSDAVAATDALATTDATTPSDNGVAPGKSCNELLSCALACSPGNTACLDTCAKNGSPAAKQALAAVGTCAADLCGDVTQTTAQYGCQLGACWEQIAACAEISAGQETCGQTVACLGRCAFGERSCQDLCLQRSAAGKQAGAWLACAEVACAGVAADGWAACAASKCSNELEACAPDGVDCVAHSTCLARCPASLPAKPNACRGVCDLLALPEAVTAATAYETCKKQCDGVLDANCVAKQCKPQQEACYGTASGKTCVEVYECIKSQCEGIGSPDPCVFTCLSGASANATEAFVSYEGCVQVALGESQATTVGCTFPYDEKTCISVLNGFCGKQYSGCFKPN